MADLTATTVANNFNKVFKSNGLGPRTRILSLSKSGIATAPRADLVAVVRALTAGGVAGTNDAATVAGVAWATADVVHLAVQGTGALTAAADYLGVTGVTMALVADFDQA